MTEGIFSFSDTFPSTSEFCITCDFDPLMLLIFVSIREMFLFFIFILCVLYFERYKSEIQVLAVYIEAYIGILEVQNGFFEVFN